MIKTSVGKQLSTFKACARHTISPIVRPLWRRMLARFEYALVTPITARLSAIEGTHSNFEIRLTDLETKLATLGTKLATLETGWDRHVPAFLNAVSTVGVFAHEQQKNEENARHEHEDLVRRDAERGEAISDLRR